ncbi:MAG: TldD/PmbA family protein [Clostridia bacterium]|nr:TldD/PmbA family protein [Clostridia bacterium]
MELTLAKKIIFDAANAAGLEEYEIYYMSSSSLSAEALKDSLSGFSCGQGGGISLRCMVDGKMGYASTELFTEAELTDLVRRACDNARYIEKEDTAPIFAGSESYATLDLPEFTPLSAADAKAMTLDMQKQIYAASESVTDGTQAACMSSSTEIYLCNSHGLELSNSIGLSGIYAMPIIKVGEESADAFEFALCSDTEKIATLAKAATDKALAKIGAGSVSSGKHNIVIAGSQMRSILSVFASAFSAKNAQLGLSLLAGKEGEKIAADCVSIVDDPMRAGAPVQTHFDGEGVATYKKDVVKDGVLTTLLYDLTTAAKAGVASTGNGMRGSYASQVNVAPFNFSICPGTLSEDELIAKAENGIYITAVKGLHAGADATTGDFSIESEGFLIEGGKKTTYVRSFTIAGNFFELLKNIDSLSDTVEWGIPGGFTVFGAPAVLVRDMSVAGK